MIMQVVPNVLLLDLQQYLNRPSTLSNLGFFKWFDSRHLLEVRGLLCSRHPDGFRLEGGENPSGELTRWAKQALLSGSIDPVDAGNIYPLCDKCLLVCPYSR